MEDSGKECTRCLLTKPLSDFYPDRIEGKYTRVATRCRACVNDRNRDAYRKTYQTKHRKRLSEGEVHRYQKKKAKAVELFGNRCQDCDLSYPSCVYDFHHVDETTKDRSIVTLFNLSWPRIEAELVKCVMLCSNCHRIRHFTNESTKQPPVSQQAEAMEEV